MANELGRTLTEGEKSSKYAEIAVKAATLLRGRNWREHWDAVANWLTARRKMGRALDLTFQECLIAEMRAACTSLLPYVTIAAEYLIVSHADVVPYLEELRDVELRKLTIRFGSAPEEVGQAQQFLTTASRTALDELAAEQID